MTADDHNSRLLLEASRYLSGEMAAAEVELFEERLSREQAARESLADVVLLEKCILADRGSARRMPVPSCRNASHNGRSRFPATIAALASLLAVLSIAVSLRFEAAGERARASAEDLSAAALWAELAPETAALHERSDDHGFEADLENLEIPEWMFAAVEAAAGRPDSDVIDPFDGEETL